MYLGESIIFVISFHIVRIYFISIDFVFVSLKERQRERERDVVHIYLNIFMPLYKISS